MVVLIPLLAFLYIIGVAYFVSGGRQKEACYMCGEETYLSHAVEVESGFSPCDGRVEWTCKQPNGSY